MRLWIGPRGEVIELDDDDFSHSMMVAQDPTRYGLDPAPIKRHLAAVNDRDADVDFDYDTIIVMAEMNGWTRVSRDASDCRMAVSSSSDKSARSAIRGLLERGFAIQGIELEVERIVGEEIERKFCILDEDQVDRFVSRGRLPARNEFRVAVAEPSLLNGGQELQSDSCLRPA